MSQNGFFLNALLERLFMIQVSETNMQEMKDLFDTQAIAHDVNPSASSFRFMDDIDNKSSALLTHVSMLIAATSILVSDEHYEILKLLFLVEGVGYVLIATVLLRCLNIISPYSVCISNFDEDSIKEATIRLLVYERARNITIIFTTTFLISVFMKVIIPVII